jgi:hypothetical protein
VGRGGGLTRPPPPPPDTDYDPYRDRDAFVLYWKNV